MRQLTEKEFFRMALNQTDSIELSPFNHHLYKYMRHKSVTTVSPVHDFEGDLELGFGDDSLLVVSGVPDGHAAEDGEVLGEPGRFKKSDL